MHVSAAERTSADLATKMPIRALQGVVTVGICRTLNLSRHARPGVTTCAVELRLLVTVLKIAKQHDALGMLA